MTRDDSVDHAARVDKRHSARPRSREGRFIRGCEGSRPPHCSPAPATRTSRLENPATIYLVASCERVSVQQRSRANTMLLGDSHRYTHIKCKESQTYHALAGGTAVINTRRTGRRTR